MPRILVFGHKPKDYIAPSSKEKLDVIISKNIQDAKKRVKYENFIMVIIDLENNEKNGFILADFIKNSPMQRSTPIIFISDSCKRKESAHEKYHCYDYFTKPLSTQDVLKILHLCYYRTDDDACEQLVVFQIGTEKHPIRKDDIIYIDRLAGKTIVHTISNDIYVPSLSLSNFLIKHPNDFIRIHRGIVVNKSQVKCIIPGRQVVILKHNSEELYIGKSFLKEVLNSFD